MLGFHPTPPELVDAMVAKLFHRMPPVAGDTLLDPGAGQGAFVDGVVRWCKANGAPLPRITAVELDPVHTAWMRRKYADTPQIAVLEQDFLAHPLPHRFRYVIGNPPYVSILGLSPQERTRYKACFETASGRFDLYFLFFEQALKSVRDDGRLVYVTPEKFLYVDSAHRLRCLLAGYDVAEIDLRDEASFTGLVTYPTVTTVYGRPPTRASRTAVRSRDGSVASIRLPANGVSWLGAINGSPDSRDAATLSSICRRISAGVATGADDVYVRSSENLPPPLAKFAYRTIAGRQIAADARRQSSDQVMLVPYTTTGELLPEDAIPELIAWLRSPTRYKCLNGRTCVTRTRNTREWYAFHETPRLDEILRPKIMCKDISVQPVFVPDYDGEFVPRHSVYYIVPHQPELVDELLRYLRSGTATGWLHANCQRAANGFLRMQSQVLKRLPIPESLALSRSEPNHNWQLFPVS